MSTLKHLKYIATFPKIGPDMYFTHWLLFFKPFRLWFQKRKLGAIGDGSEIRPYAIIDGTKNVFIGKNVIIPEGVRLVTDASDSEAKIIIEDSVLFAPNVAVYSTTHTFSNTEIPIKEQALLNKTTIIKENSWIGINSVILAGVTIGKHVVIGANSFVNKDIPDFSVAVGNPAKVIKTL
ncbi:MAG: acyltransferase [Bacteroidetes bacterium]|jgi:acetyltransferase-like isoleucine patch superfamily enzyme|nr:acyltransferase [Bacteroidota bacterium]MCA6442014.1 acyltransferase [Bacteroidota bacterium]